MDELIEKLKSVKARIILCLSLLVIGLIIGFFIGREQAYVKEVVKWKKGEVVRDTVYMPYPVKEYETQIIERLIPGEVIHDTVTKAIIKIDTPLIARDYLIRREYLQKFFDSKEQGRLVVSTSVQYNKQSQISIDYEPVVKEIYRDKEPVFIPFLSVGYNTLNYYSIGGGMFYRDVGFEYGYNRNLTLKTDYHDFRIKLKF